MQSTLSEGLAQLSVYLQSGVVYDQKFVGPLEFKLVVPMPEQLKTTAMHIYNQWRLLIIARMRSIGF